MFVSNYAGASCSEVCASTDLACVDEAQPSLTQEIVAGLLAYWGLPVSEYVGSNSPEAPSYNRATGQAFFLQGLTSKCSAAGSSNSRICRCTCADNQYGIFLPPSLLPPASSVT